MKSLRHLVEKAQTAVHRRLHATRSPDDDEDEEDQGGGHKRRIQYTDPTIEETNAVPSSEITSTTAKLPPTFIYLLAKRWAWEAVAFRCETHPEEVFYVDPETGESILHWTCFGTPPLHVVEAILETCPSLAQVPNQEGNLPLHTACYYRASPSVVRALIKAYPQATGIPNTIGTYPLHIVCDMGGHVDCIRAILGTEGGVATSGLESPTYGRPPLYILHQRKNLFAFQQALVQLRNLRRRQEYILQSSSTTIDTVSLQGQLEALEKDLWQIQELDFWQKASLILLAQYYKRPINENTGETSSSGIIHACIGLLVENQCPPSLLEFAVLVHDQSELLEPDGTDGSLPLHKASAMLSESAIWDILCACPNACQNPDVHGNLAIRIYWDRKRNDADPMLMRKFFQANPLSIEALQLDPKIIPFLWAQYSTTNGRSILIQCIQSSPALFAR
jgi:hypothetical protein